VKFHYEQPQLTLKHPDLLALLRLIIENPPPIRDQKGRLENIYTRQQKEREWKFIQEQEAGGRMFGPIRNVADHMPQRPLAFEEAMTHLGRLGLIQRHMIRVRDYDDDIGLRYIAPENARFMRPSFTEREEMNLELSERGAEYLLSLIPLPEIDEPTLLAHLAETNLK
jgi:hypothetical protein